MANIDVSTVRLDREAGDLSVITRRLQTIADRVAQEQGAVSTHMTSSASIKKSLGGYCDNVRICSNKVGTLSAGLSAISGYYRGAERQICGIPIPRVRIDPKIITKKPYAGDPRVPMPPSAGSVISELLEKMVGKDALIKYVSKAGTAGGLLSIPFSAYRNYEKWKNGEKTLEETTAAFAGNIKNVVNNIHKMYTNGNKLAKLTRFGPQGTAQAWKTGLKRAFGFDSISNLFTTGRVSTASKFSDRFYNNFHNQEGILEQYSKKGVKGALAWAGLGLTAINRGIQNYGEYINFYVDRKANTQRGTNLYFKLTISISNIRVCSNAKVNRAFCTNFSAQNVHIQTAADFRSYYFSTGASADLYI